MRRFFVKNILFIIAVNVLVKPIWVLFIDRTVQIKVAGGSYGTYQALFNLSIIFQTVLDFGISSYNSRTIAQNPDKLPVVFPAMLSARLVLIVVYMILAGICGFALGYQGWELTLLFGVLLIQSLNALLSFIRSNLAALHKFKTDGLLSVTDRLLMIFICSFLLLYPPTAQNFKIQWFVTAQVFCYFVAAVTGYLILKRIGKVKLQFSFDAPSIFRIIKQSFPYALLIFLMSIYNRADAMMIERLTADGKNEASIWAAAFRLLDMINILGVDVCQYVAAAVWPHACRENGCTAYSETLCEPDAAAVVRNSSCRHTLQQRDHVPAVPQKSAVPGSGYGGTLRGRVPVANSLLSRLVPDVCILYLAYGQWQPENAEILLLSPELSSIYPSISTSYPATRL